MKKLCLLVAVSLAICACEGAKGPSGDPGPVGADGNAGIDGVAGSVGPYGDIGSMGTDGQPCAVTDNGDRTYTLDCPGEEPIVLNEGEAPDLIDATYSVGGEPGPVTAFTVFAFVPSGDALPVDTVVSDGRGRLRLSMPSRVLLEAGRLFLLNHAGHGAFITGRDVRIDEVSSLTLETLTPFYRETPDVSLVFDAAAIESMETTARQAAADVMAPEDAIASALRVSIAQRLQGEIVGTFVLGHPFILGQTEEAFSERRYAQLASEDMDAAVDEGDELITAEGGLWDVSFTDGSVKDGAFDTYDGAMELFLSVEGSDRRIEFRSDGNPMIRGLRALKLTGEIEVVEASVEGPSIGVEVVRNILVNLSDRENGHWLRYTDVMTNTADTAIELVIEHFSEVADGADSFGPTGDDWHTSIENGERGLAVGFYYPGADSVELESGDVVVIRTVLLQPGESVTVRNWMFKSPTRDALSLDALAAEIEAVRSGQNVLANLAMSDGFTHVTGAAGAVGPRAEVLLSMNDESLTVLADELGRFEAIMLATGPMASATADGLVNDVEIPNENECVVDNGGCGRVGDAECLDRAYREPACLDLDACLVDNGGCGDPERNTCIDQPNGAPVVCEDVRECAVDNGGCGALVCVERLGAANDCTDFEIPAGIQQDIPIATFTDGGFRVCHRSSYEDGGDFGACDGAEMVVGCLAAGADVLTLAAGGSLADVMMDVGNGAVATHEANGVAFYYSPNYSWGFAPVGAPLNRDSCDVGDGVDGGETRMCWHTRNGEFQRGYRCGTQTTSDAALERLILVR